jgi:hypothetical protein
MQEWALLFDPKAEVVAEHNDMHRSDEFVIGREDILRMLRRRPCTFDDIVCGLGMHPNAVSKNLESFLVRQTVKGSWVEGRYFYRVVYPDNNRVA